jgi:heme exporter protein A
MIEVQKLAKHFGRFSALRGLDLTISPGDFISLFGRNGAGKTTFLRILAGISRPSSGTFSIRPSRPRHTPYVRAVVGYLSHDTSLYMDLTAMENLRFFARMMDASTESVFLSQRMQEVGLAGRGNEPVRHFSRGMQQRLAIARAFLHDPDILLLDEPFTGLDPSGSEFFKRYLAGVHAGGKTCIMTIHDTRLGYELADRLVVIEKGVIALDVRKSSLSYDQFLQRYAHISES